jgi:hypothetical protein
MAELSLNTRYRERQFEADARVIVFDGHRVTSPKIADEVRDLIARRPLTRNIYIAAPFISGNELERLLREGVAAVRADAGLGEADLRLWMLDLLERDGRLNIEVQDFAPTETAGRPGGAPSGTWKPIEPELVEGWLFDLFDISGALVDAPPGVHFAKSSGKHSRQFLRASSTLLSTAACGFIAMAALAKVQHLQPRRSHPPGQLRGEDRLKPASTATITLSHSTAPPAVVTRPASIVCTGERSNSRTSAASSRSAAAARSFPSASRV